TASCGPRCTRTGSRPSASSDDRVKRTVPSDPLPPGGWGRGPKAEGRRRVGVGGRLRMDLGLRGKAALVTGASRGIGRGIAVELAREGCRVALCARGKEALDEAAAELRGLGAEAISVVADVTTEDGVQAAVDAARAAFGRVDILVNNVGGSTGTSFQETS